MLYSVGVPWQCLELLPNPIATQTSCRTNKRRNWTPSDKNPNCMPTARISSWSVIYYKKKMSFHIFAHRCWKCHAVGAQLRRQVRESARSGKTSKRDASVVCSGNQGGNSEQYASSEYPHTAVALFPQAELLSGLKRRPSPTKVARQVTRQGTVELPSR